MRLILAALAAFLIASIPVKADCRYATGTQAVVQQVVVQRQVQFVQANHGYGGQAFSQRQAFSGGGCRQGLGLGGGGGLGGILSKQNLGAAVGAGAGAALGGPFGAAGGAVLGNILFGN